MKRIFVRGYFIVFVSILFIFLPVQQAKAVNFDLYHETVKMDEDGNLCMTTHDKRATSSVTYRTIGWTIKRYQGDIIGNTSVRIKLEAVGTPKPDPQNQNYIYNYFYCDKEILYEKIEALSPEWAGELYENGGEVYLDAIMTVVEGGRALGALSEDGALTGEVYLSEYGIVHARNWSDPAALKTHYNKNIYFQGNPELLRGTYEIRYEEILDSKDTASLTFLGLDETGELEKKQLTYEPKKLEDQDYRYVRTKAAVRYRKKDQVEKQVYEKTGSLQIDNRDGAYRRIIVVFYYEREIHQEPEDFTYGNDYVDNENEIRICADTFDVKKGIPTGEKVYGLGTMQNYFLSGRLLHISGMATIQVEITVGEEVTRVEDGKEITEMQYHMATCAVQRPYAYQRLERLEIYTLSHVEAENDAFLTNPMQFYEPKPTEVVLAQNRSAYLILPQASGYLEGPVSFSQMQAYAESITGNVRVRNDALTVGNDLFLDGAWHDEKAPELTIPAGPNRQEVKSPQMLLPHTAANGTHVSRGYGIYQAYRRGSVIRKRVKRIHAIEIHTPVVCRMRVSDDIANNQQVHPTSYASLILGRNLTIHISTEGMHRDLPGYGQQDYERYTARKQVKFPFEVYVGTTYYAKDCWITLESGSGIFYLPVGVREGNYIITCRTIARNAWTPEQISSDEWLANRSVPCYSAKDRAQVTVIGRVYDLCITNVIDYPRWQSLFETGRYVYRVGKKTLDGAENPVRESDGQAPILYGSHPYHPNIPPVGLGYRVKFRLKTIGNLSDPDSRILFYPTFYYLSADGRSRQEVHLYDKKTLKQKRPYVLLTAQNRICLPVSARNVSDPVRQQHGLQVWQGEYQLPADVQLVDASVDLNRYIRMHANRVSANDPVFLRDGYLCVQFEILTVEDGQWHLSYTNLANEKRGYCNMWRQQGFAYERVDGRGVHFSFSDGDFLLFDHKQTLHRDYESWGTH